MQLNDIKHALDKSWVNSSRWECTQLELTPELLIGYYVMNLEDTRSDVAPHQLLLHATDAYIISTYQCLIHSLYAVKNNILKNRVIDANVLFSELRRRIVVVKTEAMFKKAVFDSSIITESRVINIVDKGELLFYDIEVDINSGSQYINTTFCINYRDPLI